MKIKSFYIYIILFIIIVLALILIDSGTSTPPVQTTKPGNSVQAEGIPNDEIHKVLKTPGTEAPSVSNVKKSVLDRMKTMEEERSEEHTSELQSH